MNLKTEGGYFYENGKPFFWLGDTAWLLFEKLTPDEIEYYLSDRAKKGFNVVQATILHTAAGVESGKTVCREYFQKIAAAAEYARSKGIYLALLPCWGDLVKKKIINSENYCAYAKFLGEKFSAFDNIIWVLGGDIRGSAAFDLYCGFGKALKQYNPDKLISFHPFGRTGSYRWFNGCGWLDFNMFQSGHRRYGQSVRCDGERAEAGENDYEEDNYKYVLESRGFAPVKPCLDAEPSYEGIVQGLHDFSQPYWQAKDVRRYAYWSVFAGACGFTYGHNAIMQFHSFGDADANFGVRDNWRDALSSDGARQMKYLKDLMLSVDFNRGICRDELISGNGERYAHRACFAGDDFLFVYDCGGAELRLKSPFKCDCPAYIMDPTNGKREFTGNTGGKTDLLFPAADSDRVIIIKKL